MRRDEFPAEPVNYGALAFQREFALADPVITRFELYARMLQKWQPRINLIGNSTLARIWWRHMRDSAQLLPHMPKFLDGPWLDLGSGAGFPGLVLALLQPADAPLSVNLIESDRRKSVFLQEVIRATQAPAQVIADRIENLPPTGFGAKAGLITARALAPLAGIFDLTESLHSPSTVFLLLKGQDIDVELTSAAKYRKMAVNQYPSRTNPGSRILRITEVDRV